MSTMAFVVDPIEAAVSAGERLVSFDVASGGGVVAIVREGERSVVRFGSGTEVFVPTTSSCPMVAACQPEIAFVVEPRTKNQAPNAWVVSPNGISSRFFVGDAVEDLVALRNGLVAVTYFDEGFGQPMSEEAVAVFDVDGNLRTGYSSSTTGETVVDCYAAVGVGADSVAFWPYPDWRLTIWNTKNGAVRTHLVPGTVRGAQAITHAGDRWWFFSPYGRRHSIFEWRLGSSKVTEVGSLHGPLRGVGGGRFLDVGENGPALVTMT